MPNRSRSRDSPGSASGNLDALLVVYSDMRVPVPATVLVLASLVVACTPALRNVEHPSNAAVSPNASVPTPGALRDTPLHYQYYFDRNALASSVLVGSNLVALTQSGHVLRFDKASLALTTELFLSRRARVMGGADATSVLVGFEGGRIARIDVASLSTETITTVPGSPMWVGRSKDEGPVVVFATQKIGTGPRWREHENYRIWLGARSGSAPLGLPSVERAGGPAETFFLDSRDRLWHGSDRGEWGGDVEVVDLHSGEVRHLPDAEWGGYGVYGFTESGRGTVLAFGGVTHMGLLESFVTRARAGARAGRGQATGRTRDSDHRPGHPVSAKCLRSLGPSASVGGPPRRRSCTRRLGRANGFIRNRPRLVPAGAWRRHLLAVRVVGGRPSSAHARTRRRRTPLARRRRPVGHREGRSGRRRSSETSVHGRYDNSRRAGRRRKARAFARRSRCRGGGCRNRENQYRHRRRGRWSPAVIMTSSSRSTRRVASLSPRA